VESLLGKPGLWDASDCDFILYFCFVFLFCIFIFILFCFVLFFYDRADSARTARALVPQVVLYACVSAVCGCARVFYL